MLRVEKNNGGVSDSAVPTARNGIEKHVLPKYFAEKCRCEESRYWLHVGNRNSAQELNEFQQNIPKECDDMGDQALAGWSAKFGMSATNVGGTNMNANGRPTINDYGQPSRSPPAR